MTPKKTNSILTIFACLLGLFASIMLMTWASEKHHQDWWSSGIGFCSGIMGTVFFVVMGFQAFNLLED